MINMCSWRQHVMLRAGMAWPWRPAASIMAAHQQQESKRGYSQRERSRPDARHGACACGMRARRAVFELESLRFGVGYVRGARSVVLPAGRQGAGNVANTQTQ